MVAAKVRAEREAREFEAAALKLQAAKEAREVEERYETFALASAITVPLNGLTERCRESMRRDHTDDWAAGRLRRVRTQRGLRRLSARAPPRARQRRALLCARVGLLLHPSRQR